MLFLFLIYSTSLFSEVTTKHGDLKLIHADATKTEQKVKIQILDPGKDQVLNRPNVSVKFEVTGWTPEANGKHLHFILDNNPFEDHFSRDPFVFRKVSPGMHVIRVFPVYPWCESVKDQEALALVTFYVKEKRGTLPLDLTKPMMIYSTPVGTHESKEQAPGQPHPGVLVDWFLHNVSMGSKTRYFVQISVDGMVLMSMKEWRPHYIQGLQPGEHKIKLELLQKGSPAQYNWNTTERAITVR